MFKFVVNQISQKSRNKKLKQFYEYLKPKVNDGILEVGVAGHEYSAFDNFLIKNYPYPENITALVIGDLSEFKQKYPAVKVVTYDGNSFPFNDKAFDIAHSNAVIEHVGQFEDQLLFFKEMIRVSKRGMLTTPNKKFPLEIHTRVPFLHWAPKKVFDSYLNLIGKTWGTGNYMNLLCGRDLKRLLMNCNNINHKIVKNRFMGITATFSIFWYNTLT